LKLNGENDSLRKQLTEAKQKYRDA
jgi:chromosome segregation ATPase